MNFDQAARAEHELARHNGGEILPTPFENIAVWGKLDASIRRIAGKAADGDPDAVNALNQVFGILHGDDTPERGGPQDHDHVRHLDDLCVGVDDHRHCPSDPTQVITVTYPGEKPQTIAVCDRHRFEVEHLENGDVSATTWIPEIDVMASA